MRQFSSFRLIGPGGKKEPQNSFIKMKATLKTLNRHLKSNPGPQFLNRPYLTYFKVLFEVMCEEIILRESLMGALSWGRKV